MARSTLRPSAAHRWISCPPSAQLELKFDDQESAYAAEGTFAHAVAERILNNTLPPNNSSSLDVDEMFEKAGYDLEEMLPPIIEHVNYCLREFDSFFVENPKAPTFMLTEQKLDLTKWIPGAYGTADVVMFNDRVLKIIDLKFGKGVKVEAEANPQLMIYALGALAQFEHTHDFEFVEIHISQPRLGHFVSDRFAVSEILHWAETELSEAARHALAGTGNFRAGEHCRFCKAKSLCKARAEFALQTCRDDFADPETLSKFEVEQLLPFLPTIKAWVEDMQKYALDEALKGESWSGFKLVEGRSTRKITDEEAAAEKLAGQGIPAEKLWKTTLIGLTELEKLAKAQGLKLGETIGEYLERQPGKPALVPVADKRPELQTVNRDFVEPLSD